MTSIKEDLKRILNLPHNTVLNYKPHNERLMNTAFNKQNEQPNQQDNTQPQPTTQANHFF